MRSSKQRSRNKQNRNRSVGNIVNRVFDSSGPEGKVRGTPQQVIDKYNQLARDSQLSGDRVATENFQQHAEHYTRMLAEAMREHEAQQRERHQQRQADRDGRSGGTGGDAQQTDAPQPEFGEQPNVTPPPPENSPPPDIVESSGDADSGLVETPESEPAPKPRTRRPRKPANTPPSEGSTEAAE